MSLDVSTLSPEKAAERFNTRSGAMEEADNLVGNEAATNQNGAIYYATATSAAGGTGYVTVSGVVRDRLGIAVGGTGGATAQQFDVWVELTRNKSASYFLLGSTSAGTLLDATYADGRFAAATGLGSPRISPKILIRTTTGGLFTFRITQYDMAGSVVNTNTTAGDVVLEFKGKWACAPLNRFGHSPTAFHT